MNQIKELADGNFVGENNKTDRNAAQERRIDEEFFAHVFDGIGAVTKLELKDKIIREQKEKRLINMRKMKEVK